MEQLFAEIPLTTVSILSKFSVILVLMQQEGVICCFGPIFIIFMAMIKDTAILLTTLVFLREQLEKWVLKYPTGWMMCVKMEALLIMAALRERSSLGRGMFSLDRNVFCRAFHCDENCKSITERISFILYSPGDLKPLTLVFDIPK